MFDTELYRPVLGFTNAWKVSAGKALLSCMNWDYLLFRRRHIANPPQAKPARAVAKLEGSGTTAMLATRKPRFTISVVGP